MTTLTSHQKLLYEQACTNLTAHRHQAAASILMGLYRSGVEDIDVLHRLGHALNGCGSYELAIEVLNRATELDPTNVALWLEMASCHRFLNQMPEAIEAVDRALQITPRDTQCIGMKSAILRLMGQNAEAFQLLKDPFARGEVSAEMLSTFAIIAPKFKMTDYAISLLERFQSHPNLTQEQQAEVLFHLGDLLDRADRTESAWASFERGNALLRQPYEADAHSERVTRIIEKDWSKQVLDSYPTSGNDSEAPIFIVGMPRSGTSLVEQILDSHPEIHGAGELANITRMDGRFRRELRSADSSEQRIEIASRVLPDLAMECLDDMQSRAQEARFITDKMPANFLHVGLISKLFPRTKIIFCRRHALDNCLGVLFKAFKGKHLYSHTPYDVARYYADHLRLMEHWCNSVSVPILEVRHVDMVSDQETQTRRLLEFIGVPWDDACLRFYENKRVTITASNQQVRQPIYKVKVPRWKRYENYIGPLVDVLGDDAWLES